MIKEVYVKGKRIVPDPAKSVGKGGEADVYNIGDFYGTGRDTVLKLYKSPDHPDYLFPDGTPNKHEQKGAAERLKQNQKKLRDFPKTLPPNIMAPIDLATDKAGKMVLGFTTSFLGAGYDLLVNYSQNTFRKAGVDPNRVLAIFRNLYKTVKAIHAQKTVFGDFNDLGIFVNGEDVYVIDADSMQFGPYYCGTFTANFVDPLLCSWNPVSTTNPVAGLLLTKPHNYDSDLYAYRVMLMQCLLLLDWGPYGGVYKPKDLKKKLPQTQRPVQRITVWHPEVIYPKPAIPMDRLPDDLLHHLHRTFVEDQRGDFPIQTLEQMRWTKCSCGAEHARNQCPLCQKVQALPPKKPVTVKGKVTMTRIFATEGVILYAALQEGKMRWLYHDGVYRRENGNQIIKGPLDPAMRFRIKGDDTLIGKNGMVFCVSPTGQVTYKRPVDSYLNLPVFDATADKMFWTSSGYLQRENTLAPDTIGGVLSGQTLFWTGPKFGFGFYRAGTFNVSFTFPTNGKGLKDSLPTKVEGQLLDAICYFTDSLCWFFNSTKRGSKIVNTCEVLTQDGTVLAKREAEKGDEPWMESLRGKYAFNKWLFSATDEGLVKLEVKNGQINQVQDFPDAEPFLDTESHIFLDKQGLFVVDNHQVILLRIS